MSERPSTLVIRVDTSPHIGAGHLMRCLALAQGWRRTGGRVVVVAAEWTESAAELLTRNHCRLETIVTDVGSATDAELTANIARSTAATWIVADGYRFSANWQRRVRQSGIRLMLLDDCGDLDGYAADLLVNQNVTANADWYAKREGDGRLALGLPFVLLRDEFLHREPPRAQVRSLASRVLVTFGGSDPTNQTAEVLQELATIFGIEVIAIVGPLHRHRAELEAFAAETVTVGNWLRLITADPNMPTLMSWADLAVTAGGTTLWELAYLGLPAVVLPVADNQIPATRALADLGIVRHIQRATEVAPHVAALLADVPQRQRMSDRARSLVDGAGVDRIIRQMEDAA